MVMKAVEPIEEQTGGGGPTTNVVVPKKESIWTKIINFFKWLFGIK